MNFYQTSIVALLLFLGMHASAQNNQPISSKVIIENAKVKVTEFDSSPGGYVCGKAKHHHGAHLTVLLTPASVSITTSEGKVINQTVPAGTTFWSEAETHTVINTSKLPVKAYIIEYR